MNAQILLVFLFTKTLALRIEMPTPEDIKQVRMKAAKALVDPSSYLQNGDKLSDTHMGVPISNYGDPLSGVPLSGKLAQADEKLSPFLSLPMNIASTMLKGNVAHLAQKQGLSAAHEGEDTIDTWKNTLIPKLQSEIPNDRLSPRAQEFAREAEEDHGDQWLQIAMKIFNKKKCPDVLLSGSAQVLPPWTVLALKDGGADVSKTTNGVMLDWMRYGNYCGNQMHGNGYGELVTERIKTKLAAACNPHNQKVVPYVFRGLSYDVCDDCGLDAGCAIHDSSWVHQVVNEAESEKGPTMCAANEAFTTRMHESTHSGCTKHFKDGFGVPEYGYVKLASCAMIFAPCINYEGPSLKILARVNPILYAACKTDNGDSPTHIKFLACVATHYMNYRVPLGDYSGIKLKCTPDDSTCFIQGDARSAAHQKEMERNELVTEAAAYADGGTNPSLLERSHPESKPKPIPTQLKHGASIRCGPISSPTMALCRALARHIVVGERGEFSLASEELVRERPSLSSQDLVSLDQELTSDPEVLKILMAPPPPPNIIRTLAAKKALGIVPNHHHQDKPCLKNIDATDTLDECKYACVWKADGSHDTYSDWTGLAAGFPKSLTTGRCSQDECIAACLEKHPQSTE